VDVAAVLPVRNRQRTPNSAAGLEVGKLTRQELPVVKP
jgi:hypothetical protein